MRRNNTLSWRWDYLSTCPAHCPRILFSLLIAHIQRLAQDDPIYQHNLLFSLIATQQCVKKLVPKMKNKKQTVMGKAEAHDPNEKGEFIYVKVKRGPILAAVAKIIQINGLKCWSFIWRGSDVLRKCIWIKSLIIKCPVNIKGGSILCSYCLNSSIK